jgi:hypothetical protein
MRHVAVGIFLSLLSAAGPGAAQTPTPAPPGTQGQAANDDYTRYELLAPESASFRIIYEVTFRMAGAPFYFNPIRKGSQASDEAVYDAMTGQPLKFDVVSGQQARDAGQTQADLGTSYIKASLARAVPVGGESRIRIDKTYKDARSYYREGDLIVFNRPLGIKRNSVVLPAGYELVFCNVPSQVLSEPDGRIKISFWNANPGEAPLVIKGRPSPGGAKTSAARFAGGLSGATGTNGERAPRLPVPAPPAAVALGRATRLNERAHQDRDIVYFLQPPETHAFRLYHDYTESREGVGKYLNVVRAGSTVSDTSAKILDTGEVLKTETIKGEAITNTGLDIGEPVRPDTEVVVVRFPAVKKGQSIRLRIEETYTDPGRYGLEGDQLVWDRNFGRPRNSVVLPPGWAVTNSSIPAVVRETSDGLIRLDYLNPRPDSIDVLVTAKRRSGK